MDIRVLIGVRLCKDAQPIKNINLLFSAFASGLCVFFVLSGFLLSDPFREAYFNNSEYKRGIINQCSAWLLLSVVGFILTYLSPTIPWKWIGKPSLDLALKKEILLKNLVNSGKNYPFDIIGRNLMLQTLNYLESGDTVNLISTYSVPIY